MSTSHSMPKAEVLKPKVSAFYDGGTGTFSYVVQDPSSNACAIIDPLLDFDIVSGDLQHRSADAIVRYIESKRLEVQWIIETHIHSDHLSAAQYLKDVVGGQTAIGNQVCRVQKMFASLLNLDPDFPADGSQFDHLFSNEERYLIGNMPALALHTPGHTPACVSHVIGNAAFVGDTLLMPDRGTGRTDLPGSDPVRLFHSVKKILRLPSRTRLFVGHDYGAGSRPHVEYQTTVKIQRQQNCLIDERTRESEFVLARRKLDRRESGSRLMYPAVQVNIRGGHLPPPESNEVCYLKLPVGRFAVVDRVPSDCGYWRAG